MTAPTAPTAPLPSEWREQIAERLRTQDNRITSLPIFAVQQRVRIYGVDAECGDGVVWLDCCNDYRPATPEEHERFEALHDDGDEVSGDWQRTGYRDTWEFVTCCLTEQGCRDYLKVNGHNLKEPRIYAYSGFRNAEWEALRNFFMTPDAALLTMQRERDALMSAKGVVIQPPAIPETEYIGYLRKFIAQLQDDKCRSEMRIHALREQLAASERTCAELRAALQRSEGGNAKLRTRAEAAERTVEGWKPIDTAPRDGREVIVAFDCASTWIVRNAWYRDAAAIEEMKLCGSDADETDIGWWSYRHSVTQEMIQPTHWLCECPDDPELARLEGEGGK